MKTFKRLLIAGIVAMSLWGGNIWGHVFPKRSEPKVGETVTVSPRRVCIWFDERLENASSSIQVIKLKGEKIDNGDGHVNQNDNTILEVTLPPLSSGIYRAIWTAVSNDGHKSQGGYNFTVK